MKPIHVHIILNLIQFLHFPNIYSNHYYAVKLNRHETRMPSPPTTPRSIRTTPAFPPAPKLARAKLKSSSLDHEIFLTSNRKHHRTLQSSTSVEWHHQHQTSLTIPRTGSTSSLASSTFQYPLTASNYQDFKIDIINQVSLFKTYE